MIIKSFFRQKTTIIYVLVFTLIFLVLALLNISKEYLNKKVNQEYGNSFSYFESEKDIDLENNSFIAEYQKGQKINYNNEFIYFIVSNDVKKGEILIPSYYQLEENSFYYQDKLFSLSTYSFNMHFPLFKINASDYQDLFTNEGNVYFFKLKNWLNMDKTILKIEKQYDVSVITYLNNNETTNYEWMINTIEIFIYLMILIFIIIGWIALYNVVNDDKKTRLLYKCLGYSKIKTKKILLAKILLLLLISIIPAILIYNILWWILIH